MEINGLVEMPGHNVCKVWVRLITAEANDFLKNDFLLIREIIIDSIYVFYPSL